MAYLAPRVTRRVSAQLACVNGTGCVAIPDLNSFSLRTRCRALHLSSRGDHDVRLVEVGARDGLQNIKNTIPTSTKVELVKRLHQCGFGQIEATTFAPAKWVPQLSDGPQVLADLLQYSQETRIPSLDLPVLIPNMEGLHNAINAGTKSITIFASATEGFSKANQNCTVSEALDRAEEVAKVAIAHGLRVRAAVSCIFSDPFSGATSPARVLSAVQRFQDMGCYEVSLADTLGVGTPKQTECLLNTLLKAVPATMLAGHFHDTYGQGIANIIRAYDMGIRTFDTSIAGLGGCPYAPGAKGNVSTEDVVYTFQTSGISTGINLAAAISVGQWISKEIGIPYGSRAGSAVSSTQVSGAFKDSRRSWEAVQDTGEYRVSRSGSSLKITLTRSNNGNALTDGMLEGLTKLFTDLVHDSSIYHIILASEGKFFCTGMDLSGKTTTNNSHDESSYYSKVAGLFEAIDRAPQITIAAIDGPCYGGGVGLSFACDVRLVSTKARWTLSEVNIGVSPAVISKLIVREWGASSAREAMVSGRQIHPDELSKIGAVHAISSSAVPLDETVDKYLDGLANSAPRAAAINKELVRQAWTIPDTERQVKMVEQTFANMVANDSEGQHGMDQFRQKVRKIDWASFWNGRRPYHDLP